MKTGKTADSCYGVSWIDNDRILCAQNGQVEVRHATDLRLDKTLNIPGGQHVISSELNGEQLVTKIGSTEKKLYVTYCGTHEQPTQRVLHSEESENETQVNHLSSNKDYIASIDYVNKTLKVFSSTTEEHLFDIQLTDFESPYGVHLTADAVLVTDFHSNGKVSKYALTQ